jgi:transposase
VAANWRPVARSTRRVRSVEDDLQPLRPLGEVRQVGSRLHRVAKRYGQRVAQHRQHDQPRSPARGWRKRGAAANAIGRSRGGVSTKVHLVVDALGLPLAFEITEGQRHDNQAASGLIDRVSPRCLLGDKGYDSNAIRAKLEAIGCLAVIPSTASRIPALPYDKALYGARSEVECTINLLKQARRFATRYEKTLRNYAAVVALGCIVLWLRI